MLKVSRLAVAVIQGSQGGLLGRLALLSQARQFSDVILSPGERMVPGLEGVELLSRWRFCWEYLKIGRRIHQTRKKAQDFLLSSQNDDGSWGSSSVETALTLAAFWRFEQKVPEKSVEQGVRKLLSWQKPDGAFMQATGESMRRAGTTKNL